MGRRARERDSSSQNAKRFVERCELGLAKSSVPVKVGARSRPARSRQEAVLRRKSSGINPLPLNPASSHSLRRNSGSRNYHERVVGGRSTFRSPDAALESKNEGIYFWRAKRDSHHRPA